MPDMISNASMVHGRVNTLFLDYDILNLPWKLNLPSKFTLYYNKAVTL